MVFIENFLEGGEYMNSTEDAIRKAKREYAKRYREKNREKIREYERAWHKAHPGKHREYMERFWLKKAQEYLEDENEENGESNPV